MKPRIVIPQASIAELYYEQRLSLDESARVLGVCTPVLRKNMRGYSMEPRSPTDHFLGRLHSDEHRKKISTAQIGRVQSKETRRRISETRKAIGFVPWNKGLRKATHPDLVKYGNPRSTHWAWAGGVSKSNTLFRQSSEYHVWRDAVFRRDNWTCRKCGKRGGCLEAHHIKSFSKFPKLRLSVRNGLTLCEKCHEVKHAKRNNR